MIDDVVVWISTVDRMNHVVFEMDDGDFRRMQNDDDGDDDDCHFVLANKINDSDI